MTRVLQLRNTTNIRKMVCLVPKMAGGIVTDTLLLMSNKRFKSWQLLLIYY